ncbi:hypothetical protein [Flectobacillus roseus]|uniref:hypothetical protein n=1 Tax=Flectobacillus roseus TaxID=502259 RepID=UPI0024B72C5C|nr:hypothetical protein [Flectobacillus roseus]MDI9870724.1 hypothetical protein [Flectobacillus roseus]
MRIQLEEIIDSNPSSYVGIAGAAAGGDIIFHEILIKLGVSSQLYLAYPKEEYKEKSVSYAGNNWIKRYDNLTQFLPVYILDRVDNEFDNIWEQTNLWMFEEAIKSGKSNFTLLALWDGKTGDGKGGTSHMISIAKEIGAKVKIIDINQV